MFPNNSQGSFSGFGGFIGQPMTGSGLPAQQIQFGAFQGAQDNSAVANYQQQMQVLAHQQAALREQEERVAQQQRQVQAQFLVEQERARMAAEVQKRMLEEAERARQMELWRMQQEEAERRKREEAARQELLRQEMIRQEVLRQEAARQEALRQEAMRQEIARQEAARLEAARQEAIRQEMARQEAMRRAEIARQEEMARQEALKQEALRQEAMRQEALRQEAMRQEALRQEALRQEALRQEALRKEELARQEAARQEALRQEALRQEALRKEELARQEALRQEALRQEALRQEALRQEALRQEALRQEALRQEALRREALEREEQLRLEAQRQEAMRQEALRQEALRQEAIRQEALRQEAERQEFMRQEAIRQEALRQEALRQEREKAEEQQRLLQEARAREEFERNQALIAENQARLEAERKEMEEKQRQWAAMSPEQRVEAEVLQIQSSLTPAQQHEIQTLVAAVVNGEELSLDQQITLKRCLTATQLEQVRAQMLEKLAEQQVAQTQVETKESDALREQLALAAAKSAELEAEMKKHDLDMAAHFGAQDAPAPVFPAAFEMGAVANPFETLPAPRKPRTNNAAKTSARVEQKEWKAEFVPPAPVEAPKQAPLSGGVSAEERKRQIEAEVRKKIEEETRAKMEAEKKRIEEDVRKKIEGETRAKKQVVAAVAAPATPFDEEIEVPAPKKLTAVAAVPPVLPPRDDHLINDAAVAPPPPPPSRRAPPPPGGAAVVDPVSVDPVPYRNPFEDPSESVSTVEAGRGIVTLSGWLHKKGAIVKSYKRRWMVLRGNVLQWYESERQPTAQGSMELVLGTHVVVDTPGDVKFEIHPKDAKERAYFFKAESSGDKKRWLTALQEILEVGEAVVEGADRSAATVEAENILPPIPPRPMLAETPVVEVLMHAEHRKLASTLSALSGLGMGDDEDDENEEEAVQEPLSQFRFVSKVRLAPPSADELKHSQDLATMDWFEDRLKTPERGFARSAYLQDRASISSLNWSVVSQDERDTWRLLILNTMLMEKEQLACDLALLRTLWLPVFGGGVKKSKIKTLVRDPIFAYLEEQAQEMFDRHRNLAVQLAQQRNAFFETRSFGEMVLKLANYAAKIDILFVEAFPSYVAAYTYYARTNAKFGKFIEAQKTNVDLAGRGFVECLRAVVDHFDRFNQLYNDLLECTDPVHPDYGQTQKAVFVVLTLTERLTSIDETCRQFLDVGAWDEKFDPPQKGFYAHDRRVLKHSKCSYFVKEKKRYAQKTCNALLCNDMLVIAEEFAGKAAGEVKALVHAMVDLEGVVSVLASKDEIVQSFKELEQAQVEMAATGVCVVFKKDKKELFFLDSAQQKDEFVAELNTILGKLKTQNRIKNL